MEAPAAPAAGGAGGALPAGGASPAAAPGGPAALAASLFVDRPDFPRGLRVLLLDGDDAGRVAVGAQLEELGYAVACTARLEDATRLLVRSVAAAEGGAGGTPRQHRQQRQLQEQEQQQQPPPTAPGTPETSSSQDSCGASAGALRGAPAPAPPAAAAPAFDVVLADVRALGGARGGLAAGALASALAAADVALVIMGAAPNADEVMGWLQLGAADVLERPLSALKLRTLWQHTVRRAMARARVGLRRRRVAVVKSARGAANSGGSSQPPAAAAASGLPPLPPPALPAAGACAPPAPCGLFPAFDGDEDLTADLTALFMGPLDDGGALDLVGGGFADGGGGGGGGGSAAAAAAAASEEAAAAVAALMAPPSRSPPTLGRPPRPRSANAARPGTLRQGGSASATASELSCGTAVNTRPWPAPAAHAPSQPPAAGEVMCCPVACAPPPGAAPLPWGFTWGGPAAMVPGAGLCAGAGCVWGLPMASVVTAPGIALDASGARMVPAQQAPADMACS